MTSAFRPLRTLAQAKRLSDVYSLADDRVRSDLDTVIEAPIFIGDRVADRSQASRFGPKVGRWNDPEGCCLMTAMGRTAFVIMPFSEEFLPGYGDVIRPIVESARLLCLRADQQPQRHIPKGWPDSHEREPDAGDLHLISA